MDNTTDTPTPKAATQQPDPKKVAAALCRVTLATIGAGAAAYICGTTTAKSLPTPNLEYLGHTAVFELNTMAGNWPNAARYAAPLMEAAACYAKHGQKQPNQAANLATLAELAGVLAKLAADSDTAAKWERITSEIMEAAPSLTI